jgi:uncharacterized protein YbjT (DUF2867 family)
MKILLTGATGYIGKRLLPRLIAEGHELVCCVRDSSRFIPPPGMQGRVQTVEVDFLDRTTLAAIPAGIDCAYYLVHSMSSSGEFGEMESTSAINFRDRMDALNISQVVYLSGIVNQETLSRHLASRKHVEDILASGRFDLTTLRAGIIVGSGSASFEIIRDLVEKLPIMVTPAWLNTRCQPIGIRDVIELLLRCLKNEATYNRSFDIGGPDIMTYREMLLGYAAARGLKRAIWTVPVMTPRLSSYWLYFVTSTSFTLAQNLVNSMKVEVICRDNEIMQLLDLQPRSFMANIRAAFEAIEQNSLLSSWKDSMVSGQLKIHLSDFVQVPEFGCLFDRRSVAVADADAVLERIWHIGGDQGWYYLNWLWRLRGFFDKLCGGVGLRRGRTSADTLHAGEALDFWRVLLADKAGRRLLLFAEMKLPGEAWLEFRIDERNVLHQTATFRPKGLWGRIYWYALVPAHQIIFGGMIRCIAGVSSK